MNFLTENPCNDPVDGGMGFQSITAYYYSRYDEKCKKFTYRGHGGNSNRFSSLFECKKQCASRGSPYKSNFFIVLLYLT